MNVTRQLFELQELDNDIESTKKTLDLKQHQLNNREDLDKASGMLGAGQKFLDDLKKQRREAETAAADLIAKINETNKQLYGGKISNSKELANLQAEVNQWTAQKDQIETTMLGVIEKQEKTEARIKTLTAEYQVMESSWGTNQAQLAKDIDLLTKTMTVLLESRKEAASKVEAAALALYERIRRMKKPAVTIVEQGICKGCRLSVSSIALQKARGGHPVQCGACGRLLYVS
jgi:uncharacterized protein